MNDFRRITASGVLGILCLLLAQGEILLTRNGEVNVYAEKSYETAHDSTSAPDGAQETGEEAGKETGHRGHAAPPAVTPRNREEKLLPAVDQRDIDRRHRIMANDVLRSIHHECRDHLRNFYVRYDNPEHRGLGGGSTIILSGNVPDNEFRALLIHECGHVIDTGSWTGTPKAGRTAFYDGRVPIYADDKSIGFYEISWRTATDRLSGSRNEDFVSGYAAVNAFEDFAESFAFFTLHRDAFYERALENEQLMRKYRWLEANVSAVTVAVSEYRWDGAIPWDITRLPFRWIGETH